MNGDQEFTGQKLLALVIDIERAVGRHMAGATPLGRAVTDLAELAAARDPELSKKKNDAA